MCVYGCVYVCERLTGMEGPGVGVACVTVVTALPWLLLLLVEDDDGAGSEEEDGSVDSCVLSPPC